MALFFVHVIDSIRAQDASPSPAPAGMVTMNLKLGIADLASVEEILPDLLSTKAQYHMLEKLRILRITDRPENIEAVRKIIEALSVPAPNVRITVVSRSIGNSSNRGFGVGGNAPFTRPGGGGQVIIPNQIAGNTPGVIRQPTINGRPVTQSGGRIILPQGGVEIGGSNQTGSTDTLVSQSLLVRSGGTGVLEVVREVPLVDFFTRLNVTSYLPLIIRGPNRQLLTLIPGGTFEVPEFRWEKAGSELLVQPVAQGNFVTVTVVPRISAIVIANPAALRERQINSYLTGADQYVEFTSLSTTVTIASGATLTIGGIEKAGTDFNRNFWGYGSGSNTSSGSITLKAVIEEPVPPTPAQR